MDQTKEIISIIKQTIPKGVYSFQQEYYLSEKIILFNKRVTDQLMQDFMKWSNVLAMVRTRINFVFDATMSLNRCYTATIISESGHEKNHFDLLVSVAAPFYSIVFWDPGKADQKIIKRNNLDELNNSIDWIKDFVESSLDCTHVGLETLMTGLGEYYIDGVDADKESTIFNFLFTSTMDYSF
ncbi:hypothetical protein BWI97_21140 [Siphonobacter sp. BAB-5405]|nr:hypothetical protein BWI97_21140 [Siphonobacter sp. BAB-5405]